ncbi:hypothetical protein PHLCEN_2v6998 [Hermanssonia centrifuga]|uniref:Uncharacterized protein n=1 Tax=Hermanssonia centrifuga TaxID=98765 RepID=A0A2R6NYC1_9APHY|nr:hypothetical protein PHLCEN_2v6998 [Hermanssonia centrifuga]
MNSESTPRPCGYDYSTIQDGVIKGNVVPDVLSAQSIATLPVVTATTHVNIAATILSQRDYTIYSDDEDFEADLAELYIRAGLLEED